MEKLKGRQIGNGVTEMTSEMSKINELIDYTARLEEAIKEIAWYMEDENHDQYKIRERVHHIINNI